MKRLLTILFLFCSLALSSQTIYYIDPAGADGPARSGSSSEPWLHLGYAATRVTTTGNIIYVNAGTYTETGRTSLAVGVSIYGAGETVSIINFTYVATNSSDACIYLYSASLTNGSQTIQNITITGTSLTANRGIWVGHRYGVSIHHCTVKNFKATGVHFHNQIDWMTPPTVYASGNSFYNNTVTNCSDRQYDTYEPGNLRIDGQENMNIYNCIFRNNERTAGQNGNTLNVSLCRGIKIYNCNFTKPNIDGSNWNFFAEIFHLRGGFEVYDCNFYGSANLDFSNAYNGSSTRGVYAYTLSVHDCYFTTTNGSQISHSGVVHDPIALQFEKGMYEYVYFYNNHIRGYAIGIMSSTATTGNQSFDHVYIFNNKLENIGYTDYAYTWGIAFSLENNGAATVDLDNIHIVNNTIYGGTGYNYNGIRWSANGTLTNSSIRNNIIHSWDQNAIYISKQGGESASMTNVNITYNCFYNNGSNSVYLDGTISQTNVDISTGNITTNPLLISATDYHLNTSSPADGAGIAPTLNAKDYDELIWGSPPAIGCYEGTSAPAPDTYYVSPSGINDAGRDGSISEPWLTLAYACTRVTTEGHTIHMTGGTFTENAQSVLSKGVIVIGEGQTVTRIESLYSAAGEPLIIMETSQGWLGVNGNQTISGITFDGNLVTFSPIKVNYRSNVKIFDCTFEHFATEGVQFYGMTNAYWGGTNPWEAGTMPNYWCTGNEFYNNIVTNCAVYSGEGKGNLKIGQQNGMKVYGNVITQTARAAGSNGYGIKFCDEGWNKNTKVYNNTITIANKHEGTYNFALEMWYELGGCEYYNNIIQGECDFDAGYKGASTYSIWFHHNIVGFSSLQTTREKGINIEASCWDVIINNNIIKNVMEGIEFSQIWPQVPEHPQQNSLKNIWIYNNIITAGMANGPSDWEPVAGINFWNDGEGADPDTLTNIYIWHNVMKCVGVTPDSYWSVGIVLPYNDVLADNFQVRNNIILGFIGGTTKNAPMWGTGINALSNFYFQNNDFYGNGNSNDVLFESGYSPSPYTNADNLKADPLFIGGTPYSYKLQSGSPAIRTGIYVGLPKDFDGLDWLNPPDMGVHVYTLGGSVPTVTTNLITAITSTTATSGGNVTADGGTAVTDRGICWSTSSNPVITDSHTHDGTGTGAFTSYIISLTDGLTYYVRAYATNTNGTAYGNQRSFVASSAPTTDVLVSSGGEGVKTQSGLQLIKTK